MRSHALRASLANAPGGGGGPTYVDGLSAFLALWPTTETAYSFNNTAANSGLDTQSANSTTYGTASGYPNAGLAATCTVTSGGDFDVKANGNWVFLLHLPSGLADGAWGLVGNGASNGYGFWVNCTSGVVRLATGWRMAGDKYGYAEATGLAKGRWYVVGAQFFESDANTAIWVDNVKVEANANIGARSTGGVDPTIGSVNTDITGYLNGVASPSPALSGTSIDGTGILIANFVGWAPSSGLDAGDSFHTDYYDTHTA